MTSPEHITLTMGYQKSDGSLYVGRSCSGRPDIVSKHDGSGEWDEFVDGLAAEGKLRLVEDGAVVKVWVACFLERLNGQSAKNSGKLV